MDCIYNTHLFSFKTITVLPKEKKGETIQSKTLILFYMNMNLEMQGLQV